jgi:hypothetical protein
VRDVCQSLIPYALIHELRRDLLAVQDLLVHAHNQDLLVIGAVEYSDAPALGHTPGVSPHEVVIEFLL